jgi:hypothetical protein
LQLRKIYGGLIPKLLFDELKDFIIKQGIILDESKVQTYASPGDSSSFIMRGTLSFITTSKNKQVVVWVQIVGSPKGETKLTVDVDEDNFSKERITALEDNLTFLFGNYEVNPA